jgi:hypothetical protein
MIMKIGDDVLAKVNGGSLVPCQIIGIKGDIVIVSGEEERRRAKAEGRSPIGVGLASNLVNATRTVKTS